MGADEDGADGGTVDTDPGQPPLIPRLYGIRTAPPGHLNITAPTKDH